MEISLINHCRSLSVQAVDGQAELYDAAALETMLFREMNQELGDTPLDSLKDILAPDIWHIKQWDVRFSLIKTRSYEIEAGLNLEMFGIPVHTFYQARFGVTAETADRIGFTITAAPNNNHHHY